MDRNIIFGPPGTGKTTHLLRIVEKELRENNVPPHRIAYLAFTNQAADEALSRAISQLSYDSKDFSNFRTLHSLAYRELHLKEGTPVYPRLFAPSMFFINTSSGKPAPYFFMLLFGLLNFICVLFDTLL